MIPLACALLSALGFYFSLGLGDQWWLAWLAPVPVLWLAFGKSNGWGVVLAAWTAAAAGGSSILRAYAGILPIPVLVLAIAAPSLLFALAVVAARQVQRALSPVAAMFAFAALWAAVDFLASFSDAGGSVGTPAVAEVGAAPLIQTASLVGFPGVTFLLGIVSAGIAIALRCGAARPAVIAAAFFAANAAFGYWRIAAPPAALLPVAAVESDAAVGSLHTDDQAKALAVVDAYVAAIDTLHDAQARLIVLPENMARVAPQWAAQVQAKLQAAADRADATVVAGFNAQWDGAQHNVAWAFVPGAPQPVAYAKRRLVPVVESAVFTPGTKPAVVSNGIAVEICKDMDFPAMLRSDQKATQPQLLAVPAWDFDKDGWLHARVAMLRSVENGVPMVRSARNGLLTLSDRYGRVIAQAHTTGGFTILVGDLPLDGIGGQTVYDRIGDAFGWLCLLAGSMVALFAGVRLERR